MKAFGVIFIVIAIAQAVYHFKNAASKNRFSAFDITDSNEEPDPLNQRFHASDPPRRAKAPGFGFAPTAARRWRQTTFSAAAAANA